MRGHMIDRDLVESFGTLARIVEFEVDPKGQSSNIKSSWYTNSYLV